MDEGKELGGKRKDRTSPGQNEEGVKTVKKSKGEEENFLELSYSSDEENTLKNRTPSGTIFPAISSIRNYFLPSDKIVPKQEGLSNQPEKGVKANSQQQFERNLQGSSSASVSDTEREAPKCETVNKQTRSVSNSVKRKLRKSAKQKRMELEAGAAKSFDVVSHTNQRKKVTLDDVSPDGKTLHQIASVLQTANCEDYESFKKRIEAENEQNTSTDATENSRELQTV